MARKDASLCNFVGTFGDVLLISGSSIQKKTL